LGNSKELFIIIFPLNLPAPLTSSLYAGDPVPIPTLYHVLLLSNNIFLEKLFISKEFTAQAASITKVQFGLSVESLTLPFTSRLYNGIAIPIHTFHSV
jgi:hypothetical protein